MSTIVAQTLSNGTVSTSTANCIQGSAKAWVNWTGSSGAINSSYNVSSMTQIATGRWRINFTNAFANANYTIVGYGDLGTNGFCYKQGTNTTTAAEELRFIRTDNGALFTPTFGYAAVYA